MTTIQVGNRYFPSSAIEILTQANTAPSNPVTLDVSSWVPSGALWYWVSCPLARAYACTSSNYNAVGTIDMSWVARLTQYPTLDLDKWLQIALRGQGGGNYQEMSGKTICIPNVEDCREFIWLTRCPDQHDYYDSAQLTLWLTGWEMPS